MNLLTVSIAGYVAAMTLSLSPWSHANAQTDPEAAPAVSASHGDWTLRQREDWLSDRLEKSRDDGSLDHHEYEPASMALSDLRHEETRMRDQAQGQLTDNQTADLEARLDDMAAKIHWAHVNSFTRPW